MKGDRRIVITGMGCVSPVGNDVVSAWDAICNGRSGIGLLEAFDPERFSAKIAGEVRDFDVGDYLSPKEARKCDTFIHYGMAAAIQAIADAGLSDSEDDAERIGLAIGSGIGGISTIEQTYNTYLDSGPRRISPFFIPGVIINMIAGNLSIKYGYQGPNISIVTACTTATHNIGDAARIIAYGDADVMVAGGGEFGTTPTAYGGFTSAKALSTRNDEPEKASRPWDVDRDGFVLSNGAGIVVLEELEHAKKRGATIYAEVAGYGMSGDAYHITSPAEGGEGAARCMSHAMRDAGVDPSEVDYINAHGTSTQLGDRAECAAVRTCLGDDAGSVMMSSTKSMTGHLLGAAGGVEAIFTTLALRDGVIPPTINLDEVDPHCRDMDLVPHEAREKSIRIAMSNSFGFGGTNGTLLLKRFE
ncbi:MULTISPECIES: beta-ketoacyl-ACP synthase II [unclassified Wenzhouxiangella]|uniref:beta-ketoacyl-ACP synthase II n=1 Tax=unclassified Wenzhouxiangella TaxID=2613841 RepID=UPI000E325984|nr:MULTISPECIES: beta-ketoacyl-ACP synthase II [unclassified Wenzhouxiangella]RFF27947.1 beta-ketoacyl-[acyl-carrier-protein] synthase II [Wenzhouxiangella sp. 15181]RFP68534.1 beta-ketoacyl-[acyl-carrier-protein] synthase II [Wenzhouxiangella sp. 15190]